MKKLKIKPYFIFWILALLLILINFLNKESLSGLYNYTETISKNSSFNVNHFHLTPIMIMTLTLIGIIYMGLIRVNVMLSEKLNLIHIALTVFGIIFLLFPSFSENLNLVMLLGIIVIILGLLIFVGNIIYSISCMKTKTVK